MQTHNFVDNVSVKHLHCRNITVPQMSLQYQSSHAADIDTQIHGPRCTLWSISLCILCIQIYVCMCLYLCARVEVNASMYLCLCTVSMSLAQRRQQEEDTANGQLAVRYQFFTLALACNMAVAICSRLMTRRDRLCCFYIFLECRLELCLLQCI